MTRWRPLWLAESFPARAGSSLRVKGLATGDAVVDERRGQRGLDGYGAPSPAPTMPVMTVQDGGSRNVDCSSLLHPRTHFLCFAEAPRIHRVRIEKAAAAPRAASGGTGVAL